MHLFRPALVSLALASVAPAPLLAQQPAKAGSPRIQWQRSLRDALALAQAKKLPLLIAVNQDGEPACENLVRGRYQSEAFAALAARYVAVIASPNRHNPQDYDEAGRRIPCPRFGCVTCGEHLQIEPELFERYFRGRRVAPRHIGIGVDGKRMFDRFLDQSLNAIDEALKRNADTSGPPPVLTSEDRSLGALIRSPSDRDRRAVEAAFLQGDGSQRLKILTLATGSGIGQAALFHLARAAADPKVARAGRVMFSRTADEGSLNDCLIGLGTAPTDEDYELLLAALARAAQGGKNKDAQRALDIRQALHARPTRVPVEKWRASLANGPSGAETVPSEELEQLDATIESATRRARSEKSGEAWLEVAAATFRYALNRLALSKDPTFLLMDVDRALVEATKLGVPAARAAPLRARALWMLNKRKEAGVEAARAVIGPTPALLTHARSHTALRVFEIFAATRQDTLYQPLEDGAPYPKDLVNDIHAAHRVIAGHPGATPAQIKAHLDFLLYLGARYPCGQTIAYGLKRFPADATLHQYHRDQCSWATGNRGLETAYDSMQAAGSNPATDWFAGYSCLLAAEGYVRDRDLEAAERAYQKSVRNMLRSGANAPAFRDTAAHYAALAYGGLAQLAFTAKNWSAAEKLVLQGASSRPASFGSPDGLGNTLTRTARRLRRRLTGEAKTAFEKKIENLGLSFDSK